MGRGRGGGGGWVPAFAGTTIGEPPLGSRPVLSTGQAFRGEDGWGAAPAGSSAGTGRRGRVSNPPLRWDGGEGGERESPSPRNPSGFRLGGRNDGDGSREKRKEGPPSQSSPQMGEEARRGWGKRSGGDGFPLSRERRSLRGNDDWGEGDGFPGSGGGR